jgi:hypothetical protein
MASDVGRRPLAPFFYLSVLCSAWLTALPGTAAGGAEVRAVVELFTSQGCSSCPPADKLLGEIAKDPSVVAMTLPVDYWDYLGWKDTLANSRYSARQRAYARKRGDREVATPQVVVNGIVAVIGSDKAAIERAIAQTRSKAMIAPVSVAAADDMLTVKVGAVESDQAKGEVWLCAISKAVPVNIGRGENNGRSITYHNVSRRWLKIGEWNGRAESWTIPLTDLKADGIDAAAAVVQSGTSESPGIMLGAGFARLR